MSVPPSQRRAAAAKPKPASPLRKHGLAWVRAVLLRAFRLEPKRPAAAAAVVRASTPDGSPRPPEADPTSPLLVQQRAELGARLLVHDPATQVVRHLFRVHDELRRGGWAAVETLPAKTIARALAEAEILAIDEPTPMLATIVEMLTDLKEAVESREAIEARDREFEMAPLPEVSHSDFGEFEALERSWAGTVPAGL